MKKRLLSLLLVMMMLITAMPLASASSTNNFKINWLVQNNIVQGRAEGDLALNKEITRAEFTRMVLSVTGELNQANLYAAASAFKDVNNHWAKNLIAYATQRGYLAGYGDGSFRPDAPIKLDECVAILARLNPDFAEPKVKTGYWAQAYIDYAKKSGILNGLTGGGNLKAFATRQTAFEMVYNEVQVYTFVNKMIAEEARKALARQEEAREEEEARQEEARRARERKERRLRQERREREEDLGRYYRAEYGVYFNLGSGYEFRDRVAAYTHYRLPQAPAAAPAGQRFKAWSVNGAEYMAGAYVYVDRDLYISPAWENVQPPVTKYRVDVINGAPNYNTAAAGTQVTVTASVPENKKFVEWQTTDFVIDEQLKKTRILTFTMPAHDVKIKAVIVDDAPSAPTYEITLIDATTRNKKVAAGASVTVTPIRKQGEVFDQWQATGLTLTTEQKTANPLIFTMPANAVTITATFKDKTPTPPATTKYTVTFDYKGHGTNTNKEVNSGEKVTAPTAPTDTDFDFEGWYKDETFENEFNFDTEIVTSNLTLYAKWKAKSAPQPPAPQKPAAPQGLTGVAPTAAGDDGKITGVNNTMEYATNENFSDAKDVTGTEITNLAPGTYYVRVKANGNTPAGEAATATVPNYIAPLGVKSIEVISTNHKKEYKVGEDLDVTNLKIKVTKTDDSEETVSVYAPMVSRFDSRQVNPSLELTITYEGKTTTYTIKVVKKDGPEAPTGLASEAATSGNNGKITGVNTNMEYATKQDFSDAQDVTGTEITGLAPGTYYVRFKATETTEAGKAAPVSVGRVQEAEYGITVQSPINGTVTAKVNGTEKSLNVRGSTITAKANDQITIEWTPNDDYELANIEVYYLEGQDRTVIETKKSGNTLSFKMPKKNLSVDIAFSKINSQIKKDVYNKLKALEPNNEPNFNAIQNIVGEHKGSEGTGEIVAEVKAGINKYLRERKSNYIEAIDSYFRVGIRIGNTEPNKGLVNYTYTVTIAIQYLHTKEQEAAINTFVENYINSDLTDDKIKAKLNKQDLTADELTYEKIKAVHDYIITNAAYIKKDNGRIPDFTTRGTSTHSPYAIVSEKVGVCQAYAGLFQKFMNKLKIECYYVTGNAGGPHAWNLVKIGDKYYNIDLTFDDPSVGPDQDDKVSGRENYDYFLKSDASFSSNHTRDENVAHKANEDYQGAAKGYLNGQSQN